MNEMINSFFFMIYIDIKFFNHYRGFSLSRRHIVFISYLGI